MKLSKRFLAMCFKLIPAFTAYASTKHNPESDSAQRARVKVRVALQDLGTTLIKLGQLLSVRPDIIGIELAAELRNLLDNEPVIPFADIQQSIEAETKMPHAKLFKDIDETPLGTASIAQVHRGTLLSGTVVALKVRRPNIETTIRNDLPVLKKVSQMLEYLVPTRSIKFTYLYDEFEDWITNELDFRVEGRRADKLRENMKDVEGVAIPHVYWEHTSERLLVMSYMEGRTLNNLLNAMKVQHVASLYELSLDYTVDPDKIIQRTIAAVAKQALVDRYFHGDLHPANLIIQRHSKVAFVDFGIVGTINAEEHAQILLTLVALVQNDPEALVKVLKSLAVTGLSAEDISNIHQQVSDELHKLHEDGSSRVSLNHFLSMVFVISQSYTLSFTQGFLIAIKTIAQIDSVAGQIGLRVPLVSLMKPEVEKCLAESMTTELSKDNISGTILGLVEAGRQLPKTINEFEELIHSGELLQANQGRRPAGIRPLSRHTAIAGCVLAISVPLIFWYAPVNIRFGALLALVPLSLLLLLVTILRSERE